MSEEDLKDKIFLAVTNGAFSWDNKEMSFAKRMCITNAVLRALNEE